MQCGLVHRLNKLWLVSRNCSLKSKKTNELFLGQTVCLEKYEEDMINMLRGDAQLFYALL